MDHVSRGSNQTSYREDVLWSDDIRIAKSAIQWGPTETKIPVLFGVPFEVEPTSVHTGFPRVEWRLEVEAEIPGVDLDVKFVVPMHQTPWSEPGFELTEDQKTALDASSDELEYYRDRSLRVSRSAKGGLVVHQPRLRHSGMAIGLLIVSIFWGTVAAVFIATGSLQGVIGGSLALLFEALWIPWLIGLWLDTGSVRIDHDQIAFTPGRLSPRPEQVIARDEVKIVQARWAGSAGTKTLFDVIVVTRDGGRHPVLKQIPGRELAHRFRDALENPEG